MTRALVLGSLLGLVVSGCALFAAPPKPDPSRLGCYQLTTSLESYGDSLGYELPEAFRLGYSDHGQWTVLPTDEEWHPGWTTYDNLPSGYIRRAEGRGSTGPMQWDSIARIPGDSFDVHFPSAIGTLVLRLGDEGETFGGRAEWVYGSHRSYLNEGATVVAARRSCEGLETSLRRTRYR